MFLPARFSEIAQSRLIRATDIAGPKVVAALPTPDEDDSPVKPVKPKATKKKPARDGRRKKPQHFYDRAQQRKRDIAKAGKKKRRK